MFVTEQQAQRRWCPFGRQPTAANLPSGHTMVAANRQPNGDVPACLGSLCMCWRWASGKQLLDIDPTTDKVMEEEPRLGYCGLSGKPENWD